MGGVFRGGGDVGGEGGGWARPLPLSLALKASHLWRMSSEVDDCVGASVLVETMLVVGLGDGEACVAASA